MHRKEQKSLMSFLAGVILLLALFNIFIFLNLNTSTNYENQGLEYIPVSNNEGHRALSVNTESGDCEWVKIKPPRNAPQDTDINSTLVAGFPGSGKRAAFMQLEGMTELRAGDDQNITAGSFNTRFALKKTNYPHHDGAWEWGGNMKQVVLLVRNPRWALPSYHHLLYEIEYADSWILSYLRQHKTYTMRSPIEDWIKWRDTRFDVEIKKWGWFIDFWMEGGVARDIFSHNLTTLEHFDRLKQPVMYAAPELTTAQNSIGNITAQIDSHCVEDMNCTVVAIASFEKMIDRESGPSEIERFVAAIDGKTSWPMMEKEARECVWHQMIVQGKGFTNTYHDREGNGPEEDLFSFTIDQMQEIQLELERVRNKYSNGTWVNNTIAQSLVGYVDQYIANNTAELDVLEQYSSMIQ